MDEHQVRQLIREVVAEVLREQDRAAMEAHSSSEYSGPHLPKCAAGPHGVTYRRSYDDTVSRMTCKGHPAPGGGGMSTIADNAEHVALLRPVDRAARTPRCGGGGVVTTTPDCYTIGYSGRTIEQFIATQRATA